MTISFNGEDTTNRNTVFTVVVVKCHMGVFLMANLSKTKLRRSAWDRIQRYCEYTFMEWAVLASYTVPLFSSSAISVNFYSIGGFIPLLR